MGNYKILRKYCDHIYYVGCGNFWLEDAVVGNDKSTFYKLYSYLLHCTYFFMTVLEIMAALFGDFSEDEMSDAVTFAMSHTIVMIKLFSVITNRELIKVMNKNMINICKEYETDKIVSETYTNVKTNVIAYFVIVYVTVAFYIFEGLRKMYTGSHFVTVVTYYPSFEDDTICATAFRVLTTIILCMMMMTMIVCVDSFTMAYLIMLKYKFITLRNYFERLREDFDNTNVSGNSRKAAEKLTNGLKTGIVMHSQLLQLGKDIDKVFGTVTAMQLFQSSGSAVSLLLQIALSNELTLTASMKIIFFVLALFFLLGLFLCNAGDITYQASLLSDAIFQCGWHACSPLPAPHPNHQKLVLQACAQAQRPPVMKAFNMIELTYGTFLTVLRGTYSVFALFYARNE